MRLSLRIRLILYVLALGLATLAFVSSGVIMWKKRVFYREQLDQLRLQIYETSEEFKASFQDLNFKLLRYEFSREPGHLEEYRQADAALARWLGERPEARFVPEMLEIVRQLRAEYGRYRRDAQAFLARLPPLEAIRPGQGLMTVLENDSNRILALGSRLDAIEDEAWGSFLARASVDLERMEMLLAVAITVMFLLLLVLAWVVYAELIRPLQRTVVESRALLERREKLSALGLLTAGLAHEIRNPLNSIKARLYTQRRMLGEGSPALEDNRFIDEEIDRLEGIVQGALQFARPSVPQRQPLRLGAALEELADWLRPSLDKAAVQLRTELGADQEILVDPGQFKQALLNLVNNAVDSAGRGGTVTLRSRPATMKAGGRQAAVAIEIEDSGPGIPPEVRPRLFDPFFTTKENGTGLGLSITARIVEAHGGRVECESEPGRGALFRVILPLAPVS